MKANFDTSLRFRKALEFLNELNEHKIETDFQSGEGGYFICEVNDQVKNILNKLGVDTRKLNYYDEENGVDILEIWSQLALHYGQDIYYTGNRFIVWDKTNKRAQETIEEIMADYKGQQHERPGDKIKITDLLGELQTVHDILKGGR